MKNTITDILTDKKKIREQGLIIIDTEKILKDLIYMGYKLKYFLYSRDCDKLIKKYKIRDNIIKIKQSLLNKLSNVETNQGFAGVFEIPKDNKINLLQEKKFVLFDTIQDPANAGAIIRSGVAFEFYNYLFLDSVYIFNNKTIRSSAGTCFVIKYADIKINDLERLKKSNYKIIITDSKEGKNINDIKNYLTNKFVLVFGNEGSGIRQEIKKNADEIVKIDYPDKRVESLNVSNAAGILFYEINKILT